MAHSLPNCVSSLQSSIALLSSSISILDAKLKDYPRVAKLLQTQRHFELLHETALQSAQSQLISTITPEITSLFSRIEVALEKLERRQDSLRAKCELNEGRLESLRASRGEAVARAGSRQGEKESDFAEGERDRLRLKQVRQKKERLGYAVERLQLQSSQKQRQLRMSMAAQDGGGVD
ncbi:MAG: hypothetical protein MMC33_006476 [Icmadophila ericetorum]|nr:hypothetical protein [Icmadophila ericetorum]